MTLADQLDLKPVWQRYVAAEHRRFTQSPPLLLPFVQAAADDVPVLIDEIERLRKKVGNAMGESEDPEIWVKTEEIGDAKPSEEQWVSPVASTSADPQDGYEANPLTAEVRRLRAALKTCFRALAYSYGGSARPPAHKREKCALWDAMIVASDALEEKP